MIEHEGIKYKYGVMDWRTAEADLLQWKHIYLAGRMHKPTLTLKTDSRMTLMLEKNLKIATNIAKRSAISKFGPNFKMMDFLREIVSISFDGDIRMFLGENQDKVDNIVRGQFSQLEQMYKPLIAENSDNFELPESIRADTIEGVRDKCRKIVRCTSFSQGWRSFLAGGVGRSFKYWMRKIS